MASGRALGPAFGGHAGSVGAQLAAFTVDAVSVLALAIAVQAISGHVLLTLIAVFEVLVLLWLLEARTGATPGNLAVRLRTSRADSPYSPGAGRVLVRHIITGAGFLIAVVGAWAVVASGVLDSSGRARSLAARASGTQAVTVPRRVTASGATGLATQASVTMPAVRQPAVTSVAQGPGSASSPQAGSVGALASPHVMDAMGAPISSSEDSVSMSMTGTNVGGTAPVPAAQAPAAATPSPTQIAPVPGAAASRVNLSDVDFGGASPGQADEPGAAGATTLLLIFDTGQRETAAIPAAINLGRKPTATEPGDVLIAVTDSEGTVSKNHARLEHSRQRTWITDQGSTNGTEILEDDGGITRLAPHSRTEMPDGARVRIGNRTFTINALLDQGGRS